MDFKLLEWHSGPESPWNSLEIIKIVAGLLTPLAVAIVGVYVVRRIESVKASVATQASFQAKWSDEFYAVCQEYLKAIERFLTVFITVGKMDSADIKGPPLIEEIHTLAAKITELQLRLRLRVIFAPKCGQSVINQTELLREKISALVAAKGGNLDEIFDLMSEFNSRARAAHAEMLRIELDKQEALLVRAPRSPNSKG